MDPKVSQLHRRLNRSKIVIFAIVGFLILLSFIVLSITNQLAQTQTLQSRASQFTMTNRQSIDMQPSNETHQNMATQQSRKCGLGKIEETRNLRKPFNCIISCDNGDSEGPIELNEVIYSQAQWACDNLVLGICECPPETQTTPRTIYPIPVSPDIIRPGIGSTDPLPNSCGKFYKYQQGPMDGGTKQDRIECDNGDRFYIPTGSLNPDEEQSYANEICGCAEDGWKCRIYDNFNLCSQMCIEKGGGNCRIDDSAIRTFKCPACP